MAFSDKQEQQLLEWVRSHLPEETIINPNNDFRDGSILIKLSSKITHSRVPSIKNSSNIKGKIQNIEIAMEMITKKYGTIEGVSVCCIANGNKDQTLSFLNFVKLQRRFEKERRKQQHQKIRKDLKAFEEKTKSMRNTINFSVFEESSKASSMGRKRAFTTKQGGIVDFKEIIAPPPQEAQFRERSLSLLNPIAHSKKIDKRFTVGSSQVSKPFQGTNGFIIEQMAQNQPKRSKTSETLKSKKQKRECRKVGVRNGSFEKTRSASIVVGDIKTQPPVYPLKKSKSPPIRFEEKNTSQLSQINTTLTIVEPIPELVPRGNEISENDFLEFKDDVDQTNFSQTELSVIETEAVIIEEENESTIKTPPLTIDLEQTSYLDNFDDEKEIERCDSITVPNLPPILPSANTEDLPDSTFSSNASSPRSGNESDEETFIEFDEKEDEDLIKCVVTKQVVEEPKDGVNGIKEISKNIFDIDNVFHVVVDIINGENVLKPLDLTDLTLTCFVQSLFRTKIQENDFQESYAKRKQHLVAIEKSLQNEEKSIVLIQSVIRGYQFRVSKLWQRMRNLKCAVIEIIESERKYINDLKLVKEMIDRTRELMPRVDIVNQAKLVNETMINCNSLLLKNLEGVIKNDSFGRKIHTAFNLFTKYLSYYSTYMNIYFPLKAFYESDNSSVKSLVKKISKDLFQNTPPDNYLIRPIQRPPRYKLLLGAVRENLPSWWDVEDKELKVCISKLRDAIFHLNSCMKKNAEQKAVDDLFSKLSFPKKFQPSRDVQRRIVHQGFLLRKSKKEEEFCCFLLNDYFIMTKIKREEVGDVPSETLKTKTKVYHIIDLRQVTLMDVPNDSCTFVITIPEKCFVLKAESEQDKITWMHEIDGIFALQQQKLITRIENLQTKIKNIDIEVFNRTEFLIHPEYEDTINYFNQNTNEWEQFYMMLHGNVVCLFLNGEEAATLQQPTLVFDILQLKFKGLLVSQRKFSFEMNYKNFTYIFAAENNHCKFIWLSLLRNAFYKNCRIILDLHEFGVNEFNTDLLKTWTSFDEIPPSEKDNYKYLRMLLLQPHNQICADCSVNQSSHVDLDYGVFICAQCADVHTSCKHKKQSYDPVIPFAKCLEVPFQALAKLHEYGNVRGTILYSKKASQIAYRPSVSEIQTNEVLRKRWTMAKYVQPKRSVFDF